MVEMIMIFRSMIASYIRDDKCSWLLTGEPIVADTQNNASINKPNNNNDNKKTVSMTRNSKCHNHRSQTNPWHHEEESLNTDTHKATVKLV